MPTSPLTPREEKARCRRRPRQATRRSPPLPLPLSLHTAARTSIPRLTPTAAWRNHMSPTPASYQDVFDRRAHLHEYTPDLNGSQRSSLIPSILQTNFLRLRMAITLDGSYRRREPVHVHPSDDPRNTLFARGRHGVNYRPTMRTQFLVEELLDPSKPRRPSSWSARRCSNYATRALVDELHFSLAVHARKVLE